jgi:hemerythrin
MALIDWSDEFSVNIKDIDAQHKKLIELINRLHDAMRVGQGKAALDAILTDLVAYTQTHFAFEEQLMAKHGYAAAAEHKQAHDILTESVLKMQKQYQSGALVMSVEVLQFLKQWLSAHIMGSDKRYTAHLNSKGVL